MQAETLGHRGRTVDPLYKIRKLLLTGAERVNEKGAERVLLGLRAGDPNNEVLGADLAKESVRDVYLATNRAQGELLLDKAIKGCQVDPVAGVRSLGRTLKSWRKEILAHHDTGASNGPTEGLNLCIKKVKRCGHGFANISARQTPSTTPTRRSELANPTQTTTHQNPRSPRKCVEPLMLELGDMGLEPGVVTFHRIGRWPSLLAPERRYRALGGLPLRHSRRSNAPLPSRSTASYSTRMSALYFAVYDRRDARSETCGSGTSPTRTACDDGITEALIDI